jgi:hypothetical protein
MEAPDDNGVQMPTKSKHNTMSKRMRKTSRRINEFVSLELHMPRFRHEVNAS